MANCYASGLVLWTTNGSHCFRRVPAGRIAKINPFFSDEKTPNCKKGASYPKVLNPGDVFSCFCGQKRGKRDQKSRLKRRGTLAAKQPVTTVQSRVFFSSLFKPKCRRENRPDRQIMDFDFTKLGNAEEEEEEAMSWANSKVDLRWSRHSALNAYGPESETVANLVAPQFLFLLS